MFVAFDAPRAARLPGSFRIVDGRHELLQLMALRHLEDAGPLAGRDVRNAVAHLDERLLEFPGHQALILDNQDLRFVHASHP